MSQNKLMTGILVGAAMGLIVSLFDRNTRNDVVQKSKKLGSNAQYYATNRKELQSMVQQQAGKMQNLYSRISEDASYVGEKVNELKGLTPQVKELAMETKEAFVDTKEAVIDSKNDVLSAVKQDDPSPSTTLTDGGSSTSSSNSGGSSSGTGSSSTGGNSNSSSNNNRTSGSNTSGSSTSYNSGKNS
ncbi:YtxH domain-containing protein [Planomicrobium sp. CPCC 101079]|uniref:YtxH domain-containing protein n=1 Tax=Planomicrobium sp. CPCC 101079 TaxID=2599618 RepID=UPI0021077431|nr:YtxH domain-containing protein [Planomicrobium sp. CPCC 101079]